MPPTRAASWMWVYCVATAGIALTLAGAVAAIARARHRIDLRVVAFIVLVAGGLLGGLRWTDYTFLERPERFMQGRYILPLAGVFGLAAAAAVTALPARLQRAGIGIVLAGLVGFQLLSLAATLTRFYA
jgi:hypothetical protein